MQKQRSELKVLGIRLMRHIEDRGWDSNNLARHGMINRAKAEEIVDGRIPESLTTGELIRILKALGMDLNELLGLTSLSTGASKVDRWDG